MDGFTITGGNANGTTDWENHGAGMYNESGSPTLTNCTFSKNWAYYTGAGIRNNYNSNPTLNNCTFTENSAGHGAGIYNYYDSAPKLNNCTFSANSLGGMYNSDNSNPTVINCTFSGNIAEQSGGGIYSHGNSLPVLINCILWSNSAPEGAGLSDDPNSSTTAMYSDIQGGWPGEGNINPIHYSLMQRMAIII